jgi:hypothetical protein
MEIPTERGQAPSAVAEGDEAGGVGGDGIQTGGGEGADGDQTGRKDAERDEADGYKPHGDKAKRQKSGGALADGDEPFRMAGLAGGIHAEGDVDHGGAHPEGGGLVLVAFARKNGLSWPGRAAMLACKRLWSGGFTAFATGSWVAGGHG